MRAIHYPTKCRLAPLAIAVATVCVLLLPFMTNAEEVLAANANGKDDTPSELLSNQADLFGATREVTLSEALELAASQNLSLTRVRTEIEKADAKVKQAWAQVMPVAQGEMQYIRKDHADTINMAGLTSAPAGTPGTEVEINPPNNLSGGFSVNLPLINASSWKGIQMAKTGVALAELTVEEFRRTVLFGTAQAYYTALMSRSLVGFYKEQIRSTRHHLEVAEKKFAAGSGLRIDVLRAQIELEKAEKELSNAKLSLATACDALGIFAGGNSLLLPKTANPLPVPTPTDEGILIQDAEKMRVDLVLQRKNLRLAEQQIDAAWMALLPTLNLAWKGTYQFTEQGAMGDTDRSRWNLFLNLTIPLFNYYDYGKIAEGKVVRRQAEIQLEELTQSIGQNVRQAHREYQTALTDVKSAKRQVDLAKETLKLSESAFAVGASTSLEVTDSRRTYIQAQVSLATSELKTQLALLTLLQTVGKMPSEIVSPS